MYEEKRKEGKKEAELRRSASFCMFLKDASCLFGLLRRLDPARKGLQDMFKEVRGRDQLLRGDQREGRAVGTAMQIVEEHGAIVASSCSRGAKVKGCFRTSSELDQLAFATR